MQLFNAQLQLTALYYYYYNCTSLGQIEFLSIMLSRHCHRTLNAGDLIEKFSELIPDNSAQAVVWTTAMDAELDKKLAPHTWAGHYAHTWGAPTFFLQQHSNVFAGKPVSELECPRMRPRL